MPSDLKPGQAVRCTVVKLPRTDDDEQTILRLMRRDAGLQKRLRRAQMIRRRTMVVYNRGNRDWYKRKSVGKIAEVAAGATWTFPYDHDVGRDMLAVAPLLRVEPA